MSDIFLSYTSSDRELIRPLVTALETQGLTVFWDRVIPVGKTWHGVIGEELNNSSAIVVVWSQDSVDSEWVLEEAGIGKAKGNLFPIRLDDTNPPLGFGSIQSADFSPWAGNQEHPSFQSFVAVLDKHIQGSRQQELGDIANNKVKAERQPLFSQAPKKHDIEKKKSKPQKVLIIILLSLTVGFWADDGFYYLKEKLFDGKQEPIVKPALIENTDKKIITKPIRKAPKIKIVKPSKPKVIMPKMVKIPAGTFIMGCKMGRDNLGGGCSLDEMPMHQVYVETFKLAKFEVTVKEYFRCVNAKACPKPEWQEKMHSGEYKHYIKQGAALKNERHPIIGVSWNDAQKYIKWLSKQTRLHYRLPTEAEWEYAARSKNNSRAFPWGNKANHNRLNYFNTGGKDIWRNSTAPVGSFPAIKPGLYDMHGNVYEWVQDHYYGNYKTASNTQKAKTLIDDRGYRVAKGGSWFSKAKDVRSARRRKYMRNDRTFEVGFRLALDLR